jgi:hypothetical protein
VHWLSEMEQCSPDSFHSLHLLLTSLIMYTTRMRRCLA